MREDYFEEEEEDQVNLEKRKIYFYDIFLWLGLITTKRKRSLKGGPTQKMRKLTV